ncbi:MAG: 2-phosphosulfolactate phosphatase [Actinomycetota bacterium]|nr:2-phosphosulfolactate phosphatase [Rubrobacter sp.]MDQ3508395.1 2-phosphosulfolactate phosphatase [Actinomycetota bacterium]
MPGAYNPPNADFSNELPKETLIARYAGGAKGAREAARSGAAVVVVDAFRASATICVLVTKGSRVVPLASVEEAKVFPADFRVGERGGSRVAGFDFGNSPTAIKTAELPSNATVAMTTTNGTRVVEAAEGSPAIALGSFVNAAAVARWLADSGFGEVVIVGCGWRGQRASEDEAAAAAILERLRRLGANLDERASRITEQNRRRPRKSLTNNAAARRLKRLGYEGDIEFCLAEDIVPVVPILADEAFVGGCFE